MAGRKACITCLLKDGGASPCGLERFFQAYINKILFQGKGYKGGEGEAGGGLMRESLSRLDHAPAMLLG